jgi:hydroxypyruvate reductase
LWWSETLVIEDTDLRRAAREIFEIALRSVDAGDAVRRAVRLEGSRPTILETTVDLSASRAGVYVVAIGKAASPMAIALDEILGDKIAGGVIADPSLNQTSHTLSPRINNLNSGWRAHEGGHPLPNEASLTAARDSFDLLRRANDERAPVVFLISGGGSAAIEWPRDAQTTLAELREANRILVSCGASIAEINAVRCAFSAVKGGGLAARAPDAQQVSLIISDTGRGQESIVASGPTYELSPDAPDATSVIARYNLAERLPASILRAVNHPRETIKESRLRQLRSHYVLLDNDSALKAAADEAQRRGLMVDIARDISEQPIAAGCTEMLSRLLALQQRAAREGRIACLISGGEFACPVRGEGIGGRNAETALRCAIEIDELHNDKQDNAGFARLALLSAGTDGIDGNSPAAGAVVDETTVRRAREMNLDARSFLDGSDAYSFFNALGDALVTGPTGTNVRDLRILLAV